MAAAAAGPVAAVTGREKAYSWMLPERRFVNHVAPTSGVGMMVGLALAHRSAVFFQVSQSHWLPEKQVEKIEAAYALAVAAVGAAGATGGGGGAEVR